MRHERTVTCFGNHQSFLGLCLREPGGGDPALATGQEGLFDTTFGLYSTTAPTPPTPPALGFNAVVYTSVSQPDGSVVVGGNFTSFYGATWNGTSTNTTPTVTTVGHIARLTPSGALDLTFNPSGLGFGGAVSSIVRLADGGLLVNNSGYNGITSSTGGVSKLTANGALDTSFQIAGSGFNHFVQGLAVQVDGSIIAVGEFSSFTGFIFNGSTTSTTSSSVTAKGVARLTASGALDTTFNVAGAGFGGTSYYADRVVVQPNQSIVIGGRFDTFNGVSVGRLTRLNPNGTLDTAFNGGAVEITGASSVQVGALALQPDGKILVGGRFASYNSTTMQDIVRLAADGTPDPTFNANGTGFDVGPGYSTSSFAVQSDGSIFVGGTFLSYTDQAGAHSLASIARLSSAGQFDASFKPTGAIGVYYPGSGNVSSMVIQPAGNVVLFGNFASYRDGTPGGGTTNTYYSNMVLRLTSAVGPAVLPPASWPSATSTATSTSDSTLAATGTKVPGLGALGLGLGVLGLCGLALAAMVRRRNAG